MKRNSLLLLHFLCFILLLPACKNNTEVSISNLHCEFLHNPRGIGMPNPRLSWEINSDIRGLKQKSYHILVASSLEKLNADNDDLWDSERKSDASILVEYNGKPLQGRNDCFWKVKIRTNQGDSPWSQPALWSVGLLHEADWQAKWTGIDNMFKGDVFDRSNSLLAARYFRKEFPAIQKPKRQ